MVSLLIKEQVSKRLHVILNPLCLAVSNKKADTLDHFVFVKGLNVALKEFDVWNDFERLLNLTLIDTSVFSLIRQFKNLHLLLPLNTVSSVKTS
jgi:competence protein ComGF